MISGVPIGVYLYDCDSLSISGALIEYIPSPLPLPLPLS
jgi:hypothetical protein